MDFRKTPPPYSGEIDRTPAHRAEMASVLFMDIVKYSLQPMDGQSQLIVRLQQIVRATEQFKMATGSNTLLSVPTGDGLALVFFQDPIGPVLCAIEIARVLKQEPNLPLRMGLHTGPVYRQPDIKDELNVVGGGKNVAQRVMDSGDAGHILVSRAVADVLKQLGGWTEHLHSLGECEIKHGTTLHLYNFFAEDWGNPANPTRIHMRQSVGHRSAVTRAALYCLPAFVSTFVVRLFLDTSPVTRDRPLSPSETLTIFLSLLGVTAVVVWLRRLVARQIR
jgi:class 3 adenylate cyclase